VYRQVSKLQNLGTGFQLPIFELKEQIQRSICFINNSITPMSRILPKKLTGVMLVRKFSAFYGTRRFITAFTRARHLSLS
jgi:hypothetical protein